MKNVIASVYKNCANRILDYLERVFESEAENQYPVKRNANEICFSIDIFP